MEVTNDKDFTKVSELQKDFATWNVCCYKGKSARRGVKSDEIFSLDFTVIKHVNPEIEVCLQIFII